MRIEIATKEHPASRKLKGDLLEDLAKDFAKSQGLTVIGQEIRTASAELDLFCRDEINGTDITIECKGSRSRVSKTDLTNLVGNVMGEDTSQGWLMSTSEYTKDSKGYKRTWNNKPKEQSSRFRFYEPAELIDRLISSRLIWNPQLSQETQIKKFGHRDVDWVLLITDMGRFWTAPIMSGGIVSSVFTLDALTGSAISDIGLLKKLSEYDSSWLGKVFVSAPDSNDEQLSHTTLNQPNLFPAVIEINQGKKWSDFLPARASDFVGRKSEILAIQKLFDEVRGGASAERVFAVTGESGIGKSSLLTSIRSKNERGKLSKENYVIVIDCRAARSKNYIFASLVRAIEKAQSRGFGDSKNKIEITNPADALSSPSLVQYSQSLRRDRQVLCIVFDQFEEIYAKMELNAVFSAAESLFLSVVSAQSNIVLGFAWRTSISLPQENAAYHMWHKLRDHRREFFLKPFNQAEAVSAVKLFERELKGKLSTEVQRQIIEASAGYPWRLKKFCTYVKDHFGQLDEVNNLDTLNVEKLFERDVAGLTSKQRACLSEIAKKSPIDAHEIARDFGESTVAFLEDIPLLKRSGSSLSIYWDVFRDFLVSGEVSPVPFSFLPSSPSIASMLSVASELLHDRGRTVSQLAVATKLADGSVHNVIRDLAMFGVALQSNGLLTLHPQITERDPKAVMRRVRRVMSRHSLAITLEKKHSVEVLTREEIVDALEGTQTISVSSKATLRLHANRLITWLATSGYLQSRPLGWSWFDSGDVDLSFSSPRREKGIFFGHSTPFRAFEVLSILHQKNSVPLQDMEVEGYRNALSDLSRFGLIVKMENTWNYVSPDPHDNEEDVNSRLWNAARKHNLCNRVY